MVDRIEAADSVRCGRVAQFLQRRLDGDPVPHGLVSATDLTYALERCDVVARSTSNTGIVDLRHTDGEFEVRLYSEVARAVGQAAEQETTIPSREAKRRLEGGVPAMIPGEAWGADLRALFERENGSEGELVTDGGRDRDGAGDDEADWMTFTGTVVQDGEPVILDNGSAIQPVEVTDGSGVLGERRKATGPLRKGRILADTLEPVDEDDERRLVTDGGTSLEDLAGHTIRHTVVGGASTIQVVDDNHPVNSDLALVADDGSGRRFTSARQLQRVLLDGEYYPADVDLFDLLDDLLDDYVGDRRLVTDGRGEEGVTPEEVADLLGGNEDSDDEGVPDAAATDFPGVDDVGVPRGEGRAPGDVDLRLETLLDGDGQAAVLVSALKSDIWTPEDFGGIVSALATAALDRDLSPEQIAVALTTEADHRRHQLEEGS